MTMASKGVFTIYDSSRHTYDNQAFENVFEESPYGHPTDKGVGKTAQKVPYLKFHLADVPESSNKNGNETDEEDEDLVPPTAPKSLNIEVYAKNRFRKLNMQKWSSVTTKVLESLNEKKAEEEKKQSERKLTLLEKAALCKTPKANHKSLSQMVMENMDKQRSSSPPLSRNPSIRSMSSWHSRITDSLPVQDPPVTRKFSQQLIPTYQRRQYVSTKFRNKLNSEPDVSSYKRRASSQN